MPSRAGVLSEHHAPAGEQDAYPYWWRRCPMSPRVAPWLWKNWQHRLRDLSRPGPRGLGRHQAAGSGWSHSIPAAIFLEGPLLICEMACSTTRVWLAFLHSYYVQRPEIARSVVQKRTTGPFLDASCTRWWRPAGQGRRHHPASRLCDPVRPPTLSHIGRTWRVGASQKYVWRRSKQPLNGHGLIYWVTHQLLPRSSPSLRAVLSMEMDRAAQVLT
jgi:hypothetical protein